ncbi:hypothetical protein J4734_23980 [Klebsiella pneumoniae]|uniref:Metallo-beta-lactamase domain-containing protein n=1 Tax=Klebsiella pneumoniae TaxID=573 RepID=A0A939NQ69_KLEPN|nr:hypothetical protein [Klebsiella pneumoniae]
MQRLAGYQPADCPYPELNKAGVLRGTHIGGIILTDSQIDHTTGLLSLRKAAHIRSGAPRRFMISPPASGVLPCCGTGTAAGASSHRSAAAFTVDACPDLQFTAVPIASNAPPPPSRPAAAGS